MSISQVESGIRILNEDFLAMSDTNGANGTDCQIEFYLAETDPSGNPTNGITYSNNTNWYNDGGSYYNSLAWDTNRYLNIYTNTASGALGYVPWLPQEGSVGSSADRVVVLWESFGDNAPIGAPFNKGRTLTHEVGHYLGLHHTFNGGCGGGNCASSGDLICDTAPQSEPTYGCNGSSCSGTAPDDNYMDYSDDLCMEQFTPNQSRRMRCTIVHYRPDIASEGPGDPDYISISEYESAPTIIDPSGVTLRVRITELEADGYVEGSGTLHYDSGSGAQQSTLVETSNNVYAASLSSLECGTTLSWYFTAEDAGGTIHRLPEGNGTYSAPVSIGFGTVFTDDGESNPGYTTSATASDGAWTRGDPVGCDQGDPGTDGDGSGQCWVTGNECDSDVDGGNAVLTSPAIDASGGNAVVSYVRHFSSDASGGPDCPSGFVADCQGTCFPQAVYDDWQGDGVCDDGSFIPSEYGYTGSPPGVPIYLNCAEFNCDSGDCSCFGGSGSDIDSITVEITANGSSWVEIERVESGDDDASGGWISRSFNVSDYVTPSSTVQLRFTVVDGGDDSTVEAAIDGLAVESLLCEEPSDCPGDLNEDGVVNGTDLSLILGFWGQAGASDLNGDGTTNGADLSIILGGWGDCTQ